MSVRIIRMFRQQGKTQACIEWLLEAPEHRVIVTADERRAMDIRMRLASATETGYQTWSRAVLPWGHRDVVRGRDVEVFIDQADHVLQWMFSGKLRGVTWDA